jgi:hypothetical protein
MTSWQRIAASLVSTQLALAITIVGVDMLVFAYDPKEGLIAVIVAMFSPWPSLHLGGLAGCAAASVDYSPN